MPVGPALGLSLLGLLGLLSLLGPLSPFGLLRYLLWLFVLARFTFSLQTRAKKCGFTCIAEVRGRFAEGRGGRPFLEQGRWGKLSCIYVCYVLAFYAMLSYVMLCYV